jgi:hypothetical protein
MGKSYEGRSPQLPPRIRTRLWASRHTDDTVSGMSRAHSQQFRDARCEFSIAVLMAPKAVLEGDKGEYPVSSAAADRA